MEYQPTADDYTWPAVAAIIGLFILVTAVVTVLIWHRSATTRAKAQLVREREYRELAEGAVAAQDRNDHTLSEINSQLQEMRGRLDSFERILKDVE
ncbi:hypothetical protein [Salinispora pacifica]|uniref:hypothetical protein n=1 Tax=Salinispora pacifica TaxID=351187 RepID=UPI00035F216C|nr:hypothetical protein [Salinispora pacifica]